ncbi:hypothetical protein B7494_g2250 [Chlorociboria aeruginascens]|nr:hypothetical protein B7494_g2250 [Chlorociboria aeruginascens]
MAQTPPSEQGGDLFQTGQAHLPAELSQHEAGKEEKKSKKRKSRGSEDGENREKRKIKKLAEKFVRRLDRAGGGVVLEEIVEVGGRSESNKERKKKVIRGQGHRWGEEGDGVVDGREETREEKKLKKRAERRAKAILDSQQAEEADAGIDSALVSGATESKNATGAVTEETIAIGDAQQNLEKPFIISSSLMTPEALAAAEKQHARIRTVKANRSVDIDSPENKPSTSNADRATAARTLELLPKATHMKVRKPKTAADISPNPLQTPNVTLSDKVKDSARAFSRTVNALQMSLSSKISKDIMALKGKGTSDDNDSDNLGSLHEILDRSSILENSPSKVSKSGIAFMAEDENSKKIVQIEEGWEEGVGKVRSALNENDDAQVQENIAFSSNYILSKNSGINISLNSFQVYVLEAGDHLDLGADTTKLQICSVASGRVMARVGMVEFGIGANGMWRVRIGEYCRAINIEEEKAVLHVSRWH